MLRLQHNGGGFVKFPYKSVTKVYGSMLLALGEDGWVSNFQKQALRRGFAKLKKSNNPR